MATIGTKGLAKKLHLSESRVHQLVGEGLPKAGRGRYDSDKCVSWYIRYLQGKLKAKAVPLTGDGAGESSTFSAERLRRMTAEAGLAEIELAKAQGQLVSIADVEHEYTRLALETKARMLAIPPRIAADLLGETSRTIIMAKIEKAIKEALTQLAKYEPDAPDAS